MELWVTLRKMVVKSESDAEIRELLCFIGRKH